MSGLTRFGLYSTTQVFSIGLPSEAVGFRYHPAGPLPPRAALPQTRELTVGTVADIGLDGVISLAAGWRGPAKEAGARTLLDVHVHCARLRAQVPTQALTARVSKDKALTLGSHLCGESGDWLVVAGAKISWPDGRPAGVMTRADRFDEVFEVDGRACSHVRLQGTYSALPLCFDPAPVKHHGGLEDVLGELGADGGTRVPADARPESADKKDARNRLNRVFGKKPK